MSFELEMKHIYLKNDQKVPTIGLGTWVPSAKEGEVGDIVKAAIDIGYRHFDCSPAHENEEEVGAAIQEKLKQGDVERDELFIVNKLWNTYHREELVEPACKKSLEAMGLDYFDLYMMQFPMAFRDASQLLYPDYRDPSDVHFSDATYMEAWRGMEALVKRGLVKSIGICNFNHLQLEHLLEQCQIKPTLIQVEVHPFFSNMKLLAWCSEKGLNIIASAPLGSSDDNPLLMKKSANLTNNRIINEVARKHSKSPAQVILKWLVQKSLVAIPRTTSLEHLMENIQIFDFDLDFNDISDINSLNKSTRFFAAPHWKNHKDYPWSMVSY